MPLKLVLAAFKKRKAGQKDLSNNLRLVWIELKVRNTFMFVLGGNNANSLNKMQTNKGK